MQIRNRSLSTTKDGSRALKSAQELGIQARNSS
jgi:hypothetical protein